MSAFLCVDRASELHGQKLKVSILNDSIHFERGSVIEIKRDAVRLPDSVTFDSTIEEAQKANHKRGFFSAIKKACSTQTVTIYNAYVISQDLNHGTVYDSFEEYKWVTNTKNRVADYLKSTPAQRLFKFKGDPTRATLVLRLKADDESTLTVKIHRAFRMYTPEEEEYNSLGLFDGVHPNYHSAYTTHSLSIGRDKDAESRQFVLVARTLELSDLSRVLDIVEKATGDVSIPFSKYNGYILFPLTGRKELSKQVFEKFYENGIKLAEVPQ